MDGTADLAADIAACRDDPAAGARELREVAARVDERRIDDHTAAFGSLASETRYRIVATLVESDEERCVCELSALLEVSDSAVSHALSRLVDAGLVDRRKEGRWRYYRPTDRADSLLTAIDDDRHEVEP